MPRRPKPPEERARTNIDSVPHTDLDLQAAPQPKLGLPPAFIGKVWPPETKRWWEMWARAAQSQLFTETDWTFLHDTAVVHAKVWQGELRYAAELRIRVERFGSTPEARLRLRIFATKDIDAVREAAEAAAQAVPEYGAMRVVTDAG